MGDRGNYSRWSKRSGVEVRYFVQSRLDESSVAPTVCPTLLGLQDPVSTPIRPGLGTTDETPVVKDEEEGPHEPGRPGKG